MSQDIQPILDSWPQGGETNVRKIIADDGREKVQVRVCIETYRGILQFECDARPDGETPHGHEFALDYYTQKLEQHRGDHGSEEDFGLSEEEAKELFNESRAMYQRYVILLQLGECARVIRDTNHNMRIFRFVHQYAERYEDKMHLEKWWPYILRIHYTAKASLALEDHDYELALGVVQEARARIFSLPDQDDEIFKSELSRSVQALEELEQSVESQRPLSDLELLEKQKEEAVDREDFEAAARLRDQISELRTAEEPY